MTPQDRRWDWASELERGVRQSVADAQAYRPADGPLVDDDEPLLTRLLRWLDEPRRRWR